MGILIYGHFQILIATAQQKIPARFDGTSEQAHSLVVTLLSRKSRLSPMFSKPVYII